GDRDASAISCQPLAEELTTARSHKVQLRHLARIRCEQVIALATLTQESGAIGDRLCRGADHRFGNEMTRPVVWFQKQPVSTQLVLFREHERLPRQAHVAI